MEGSISLDRRILDWEWHDEPLIGWLWVNLLLMANYQDAKWHGEVIKRGQLVTSRDKLCAQTGLTDRQLRTRLEKLVECECIKVEATNRFTKITICKYDSYQTQSSENDQQTTNKRPTNDQQTTNKRPTNDQQTTRNNKENKDNNNNKENTLTSVKESAADAAARAKEAFQGRVKVFYNELVPYTQTYGKKMIREFFDYWTEPNKSGTKFRKELEKTWSTPRRLQTWASREKINPLAQQREVAREDEAKRRNQLTSEEEQRAASIREARLHMMREREQSNN